MQASSVEFDSSTDVTYICRLLSCVISSIQDQSLQRFASHQHAGLQTKVHWLRSSKQPSDRTPAYLRQINLLRHASPAGLRANGPARKPIQVVYAFATLDDDDCNEVSNGRCPLAF